MRMARVNISLPDDILARARAADLNISGLTARAILEELDRRSKVAELDSYLADLDVELGPVSAAEKAAAADWADRVLPGSVRPGRAHSA